LIKTPFRPLRGHRPLSWTGFFPLFCQKFYLFAGGNAPPPPPPPRERQIRRGRPLVLQIADRAPLRGWIWIGRDNGPYHSVGRVKNLLDLERGGPRPVVVAKPRWARPKRGVKTRIVFGRTWHNFTSCCDPGAWANSLADPSNWLLPQKKQKKTQKKKRERGWPKFALSRPEDKFRSIQDKPCVRDFQSKRKKKKTFMIWCPFHSRGLYRPSPRIIIRPEFRIGF